MTIEVGPGATQGLEVRVRNAGGSAGRFTLTGTTDAAGFGARYFDGDQDVTDAVGRGAYATPVLEPGASRTLTLRVSAPSSTGVSSSVHIVAVSAEDARRFDRVSADLSTGTTSTALGGLLSRTGADLIDALALALLLMLSGAFTVRLGRRHR